MKIKLLGAHNRESKTTRLVSILVDDTLVIDAGGLTSSLSLAAQKRLKAVLLTHQHYDHTRDIPALAMNLFLARATTSVYSTPPVYDILSTHLLDGKIYPKFLERPTGNPTLKFTVLEPLQATQIEGYTVLAVPVNHAVPGVGYQVTSPDGKSIFYTGDTGPGLADCWKRISPQLLVIEVTSPNRWEENIVRNGHLTPHLLQEELKSFRELKGYLPEVVTIHMSPDMEEEINAEVAIVAKALNCSIIPGSEGKLFRL